MSEPINSNTNPPAPAGAWSDYYAKAGLGAPRATLLRALDAFTREGRTAPLLAIDLGCGVGRDTLPLLTAGWQVLAIDAEAEALARLRAHWSGDPGLLETRLARFEATALPQADLVNASFALPLCPPAAFPAMWTRITVALEPGGRLACQLYGPRDSWAGQPGITAHDRDAVLALLHGLKIEALDEEEGDGVTPRGSPKHWHVFHVNARRPVS